MAEVEQFPDLTAKLTRGVGRAFAALDYATLTEFRLANGRRADLVCLSARSEVVIVEVKSSIEDFRADRKWPDYLAWCDSFYFAVPEGFPLGLVPPECGLIVADGFGAAFLRPGPVAALAGARRRALILAIAVTASDRLRRLTDPEPSPIAAAL
jgi:hypothetical protein